MGIHQHLYSSFCFLNINTVITQQLIRTARTLEAEWWQVCREEWVWGQTKMSQVIAESADTKSTDTAVHPYIFFKSIKVSSFMCGPQHTAE